MTTRADHSWDMEDDEDEAEPGRGWLGRILIVTLLAGTGSGAAFVWHAAGGSLQALVLQSSPAAAAVAQKPVGQNELEALRQQIVTLNQSNQQVLAAQQAEIKRLTDEVATLSGKVELVQRPVTSAQAALPPPKPAAPLVVKKNRAPAQAGAEKSAAAAKRDPKLVDSRPTGAISTGGAPLPLIR